MEAVTTAKNSGNTARNRFIACYFDETKVAGAYGSGKIKRREVLNKGSELACIGVLRAYKPAVRLIMQDHSRNGLRSQQMLRNGVVNNFPVYISLHCTKPESYLRHVPKRSGRVNYHSHQTLNVVRFIKGDDLIFNLY